MILLRITLLFVPALCASPTVDDNGLLNASLFALINLDPVRRTLSTLQHDSQVVLADNFAERFANSLVPCVHEDIPDIPSLESLRCFFDMAGIEPSIYALIDLLDAHIHRLGYESDTSLVSKFFIAGPRLSLPSESHEIVLIDRAFSGIPVSETVDLGPKTWKLFATVNVDESGKYSAHVRRRHDWFVSTDENHMRLSGSPEFEKVAQAFYVLDGPQASDQVLPQEPSETTMLDPSQEPIDAVVAPQEEEADHRPTKSPGTPTL
jgi:hypothetical protein